MGFHNREHFVFKRLVRVLFSITKTITMDLKNLKDLDIYSKTTIVSIVILLPFWYVSLFLFNKDFFVTNDLYISFGFTLCFSIIWYFTCVLLLIIAENILKGFADIANCLKTAGFLSVVFICGAILLNHNKTSSYEQFLEKAYGSLVAINILFAIVDYSFIKLKKKKK